MDVELALKINKIIHDECNDVPHDIGLRISELVEKHQAEQLILSGVVLQSEQLCDNPHCEDGIVDRDMYGHPIYCQVCDKHNALQRTADKISCEFNNII